ncbi:MAG: hypothetical protein EHM49_00535 [Deltaproteobacteria bacterium]|nr:MAG: hypothetical protein EHM49_00535 [Deltaproteobacteria bacterium]
MTPEQQVNVILMVNHVLFATTNGVFSNHAGSFSRQVFPKSGLHYVDFDVPLGNGKKLCLRLVEQNPNKEVVPGQLTYYAALARQGHQIAWLLDRNVPKGGNAYLGSIQNGQWVKSNPKGVQPTQPAPQRTAIASQTVMQEVNPMPEELDVDALFDVNDDIPEFVLTNYPDPEEAMDDYDDYISRVNQ